jgi:hypothetical protein
MPVPGTASIVPGGIRRLFGKPEIAALPVYGETLCKFHPWKSSRPAKNRTEGQRSEMTDLPTGFKKRKLFYVFS